jgi:hypothetical protein
VEKVFEWLADWTGSKQKVAKKGILDTIIQMRERTLHASRASQTISFLRGAPVRVISAAGRQTRLHNTHNRKWSGWHILNKWDETNKTSTYHKNEAVRNPCEWVLSQRLSYTLLYDALIYIFFSNTNKNHTE